MYYRIQYIMYIVYRLRHNIHGYKIKFKQSVWDPIIIVAMSYVKRWFLIFLKNFNFRYKVYIYII